MKKWTSLTLPKKIFGEDRKGVTKKRARFPIDSKRPWMMIFNTAMAMGYIFDTIRIINRYISKNSASTRESLFVLNEARENIREVGKVMGLFLEDPDEYFEKDKAREARKSGLDVEEVKRLIDERKRARESKDWDRADELRDLLAARGIVLKDTPTSTTWKVE